MIFAAAAVGGHSLHDAHRFTKTPRILYETPAVIPPHETVTFPAHAGMTLAGDAWGSPTAPAVVLLPGGGQTRHSWRGTGRAIARAGWYAISLDARGHGDSAWADDGDYTIDAFVADLRAVAASLPRPPVVVGASLGGITAMVAEGESPGVAAAVVLVDVAARIEVAGAERVRAFMTAFPEGFASLEEAADVVAAYLPHRPRPRQLGGLTKSLRQGPDGRWRWHWDPRFLSGSRPPSDVANPPRLAAAAGALTVPTLLVRGRESDVLSEEGARDFLRLVPHAQFADVSDAGHMVAGDRNDLFTDAVVGFLSTLSGRT